MASGCELVVALRQEGMRTIRVDHPDHCVACHSCELACSFHHLGLYQPSRASVVISRDPDGGAIVRRLYLRDADRHLACDQCEGEDERKCVAYCNREAVREALARRETKSSGPNAS